MHTTLSSKWTFLVLFLATILLAGCGVTTKKTFLDEPVQETVNNAVPVSSSASVHTPSENLSQNPALNQGEKTGMQKLLNVLTPYRINIQQGNFVSQEMLTRVQQGMTKEQVRFALGTPLLTDVFHAGRWDYIFRLQKPSGEITNNRVIIYFEDNRVARIVNDPLPNETQYLETVAGPVQKQKEDTAKSTEKLATEDFVKKADTSSPDEAMTGSIEETAITAVPVLPEKETEIIQPATVESIEDTSPSVKMMESDETPSSVSTEDTEVVAPAVVVSPVSTEPVYSQPMTREASDMQSYQADTEETPSKEREMTQADQYENRPVETSRTETVSEPIATEVESEPVYTPQQMRQETPQRATTIQDVSEEMEDDFKAAPNSTMQLHELMQPQ